MKQKNEGGTPRVDDRAIAQQGLSHANDILSRYIVSEKTEESEAQDEGTRSVADTSTELEREIFDTEFVMDESDDDVKVYGAEKKSADEEPTINFDIDTDNIGTDVTEEEIAAMRIDPDSVFAEYIADCDRDEEASEEVSEDDVIAADAEITDEDIPVEDTVSSDETVTVQETTEDDSEDDIIIFEDSEEDTQADDDGIQAESDGATRTFDAVKTEDKNDTEPSEEGDKKKKKISIFGHREKAPAVGFSVFEEDSDEEEILEETETDEESLEEETVTVSEDTELEGSQAQDEEIAETESEPEIAVASEAETTDGSARGNGKGKKDDCLERLFSDDTEETKQTRKSRGKKGKDNGDGSARFSSKVGYKENDEISGNDKMIGLAKEIDMTDTESVKKAYKMLDGRRINALIAFIATLFCFAVSLYLELAPSSGVLPYPKWLLENRTASYVLIDLQLLLIGVMFNFDSLSKGFEIWLDDKIVTAPFAALSVTVLCTLQAIVSAIFANGESVRMLCSLGCAFLTMLSLYDYLNSASNLGAFKIASAQREKYGSKGVVKKGDNEGEELYGIEVGKESAYRGFIRRSYILPEGEKRLWIIETVVFAVSVITAIISSVGESFYCGISDGVLVFATSLPLSLFIGGALPRYLAVRRGATVNSAIIGPNAGSEFKDVSFVTLEDTAIFNPEKTKIDEKFFDGSSIILDVPIVMVKIFRHVGGPLRCAFDRYVSNSRMEMPADVRVISSGASCLDVTVDGKRYCVATEKYLDSAGIRYSKSEEDSRYSRLYLVEGGRVIARFKIKYELSDTADRMIAELNSLNTAIRIKTATPGITDVFLRKYKAFGESDVAVVRGKDALTQTGTDKDISGSVVSTGGVHGFVSMLLLCEEAVKKTKFNGVLKYSGALCCLAVSVWLILFTGSHISDIEYSLLIQLFWLIIVGVVSYLGRRISAPRGKRNSENAD